MRYIIMFFLASFAIFDIAGAQTGQLMIMSNIKGSSVFINGEATEHTTPVILSHLAEGSYVVELEDRFGEQIEATTTVTAYQTSRLKLNFDISRLVITSNLEVDSVFINNVLTEARIRPAQPAIIEKVPRGDVLIRVVENQAGISNSDWLFLQADEDTIQIEFELGDMTIKSNLKKACIYLNKRPTNLFTPATLTDLPLGTYNIMLVKKNKIQKTIQLKPGMNTIQVDIKKSRLWTYLTIGAGVIGGSSLAYILSRGDETDEKGLANTPPGFPGDQ